jgi:hypothetical protein
MKSPKRLKTFLVYMHNCTNRDDDEVFKVKALNEKHAKQVAYEAQSWTGRFSVGWVKPYIAKTKRDKEFLRQYRWWASDYTHIRIEEDN